MPGWLIFVIIAAVIVGLLVWRSRYHRGSGEVGETKPPDDWRSAHSGGGGG